VRKPAQLQTQLIPIPSSPQSNIINAVICPGLHAYIFAFMFIVTTSNIVL